MKRLWLVLVIVALAAPLAAQEKKEGFAFFDSPGGGWSEAKGTTYQTGYGASFRIFSSPRFSTELSVAERRVNVLFAGTPVGLHTTPLDVVGAYHFTNESNWKPYLGLGLHDLSTGEGGRGYDSRSSAEVTGGIAYQFTPRFFIRADTSLLLQRNNPTYDQRNRTWIGLGWRF